MQNRIVGTTMPVLEFLLDHNDCVISEAGELSWMSQSIQMTTHTQFGGGGGFFGALKRVAGGGSLFMTEYRALGAPGQVAFATRVPGHIVPVEVGPGHEFMIHRHGFLCATDQIQIGIGFQQSLGAGIFGGDGIFLAHLSGPGRVWLQTLPISKLAHQLQRYMPAAGRQESVQSGVVGGIIGSLLDNR